MNRGASKDLAQYVPALIGLALAVLTILIIGRNAAVFGDAKDYLAAAQALLRRQAYPRESSLPFFRPPLYPFVIALIWLLVPGSVFAVKLVQAILFGVCCWVLYQIGVILYDGNSRTAFAGAMLYAINPFALLQVADIQTEVLHTLLIVIGMYALIKLLRPGAFSVSYGLLAGIAFGLGSLCRPTALPVGLALAFGLIIIGVRRKIVKASLKAAGLMVAGIVITIAPWTVSNRMATGEWIVITDGLGYHLWLGNHPAEIRLYEGNFRNQQEFDDYSYKYLQVDLPNEKMREWEATGGYKSLSLKQREKHWQRAALDNFENYPWLTLRLCFYKGVAFWRVWLLRGAYSRSRVISSGLFLIPLCVLSIAGLRWLWRNIRASRTQLAVLILLFTASTAVHMISHVMMRFRLPYVDPYLSVFAGGGVLSLINVIVNGRRRARHITTSK